MKICFYIVRFDNPMCLIIYRMHDGGEVDYCFGFISKASWQRHNYCFGFSKIVLIFHGQYILCSSNCLVNDSYQRDQSLRFEHFVSGTHSVAWLQ